MRFQILLFYRVFKISTYNFVLVQIETSKVKYNETGLNSYLFVGFAQISMPGKWLLHHSMAYYSNDQCHENDWFTDDYSIGQQLTFHWRILNIPSRHNASFLPTSLPTGK